MISLEQPYVSEFIALAVYDCLRALRSPEVNEMDTAKVSYHLGEGQLREKEKLWVDTLRVEKSLF